MSRSVWYCVPEHGLNLRYELVLNDPSLGSIHDLNLVCNGCAQDYWSNHDGYGKLWPLEFQIFSNKEYEIPVSTFKVDMESVPIFTSRKKVAKADAEET